MAVSEKVLPIVFKSVAQYISAWSRSFRLPSKQIWNCSPPLRHAFDGSSRWFRRPNPALWYGSVFVHASKKTRLMGTSKQHLRRVKFVASVRFRIGFRLRFNLSPTKHTRFQPPHLEHRIEDETELLEGFNLGGKWSFYKKITGFVFI